jgi:putative tricarboxylic transport membrane protein
VKSWQRIAGVFLLIVSAVVIHQSVYVLRIFDARQPGSGFMPLGLGVLLAVLSVILVLTNLGSDPTRRAFWEQGGWFRPALAVIIFLAFAIGFEWLGAIADVILLVVAWLLIVERKRVLVAILTGGLTGAVVYVLFEVALQAPFPRGAIFGG